MEGAAPAPAAASDANVGRVAASAAPSTLTTPARTASAGRARSDARPHRRGSGGGQPAAVNTSGEAYVIRRNHDTVEPACTRV